jgi:hypothetical protein
MTGWMDLFRSLGEALLEVLRAEMKALQDDLTRSGRHVGIALALLGGAAAFLFWIVGLLVFFLVALLDVWLTLWGAALAVLALFVLVAGTLGALALRQLRKVENPAETVRRHMDSHLDWWQNNLLAQPRTVDVPAPAVGDGGYGDPENPEGERQ